MFERRVVAVVGAALVSSIAFVAPSGAQDPMPTSVRVSPSGAYPGQTFEVSGSGCIGDEGKGTRVDIEFRPVEDQGWGYVLAVLPAAQISDDGTWSTSVSIPVDHPELSQRLDSDDNYVIDANCTYPCTPGVQGECVLFYAPVPFDLLPVPGGPTSPPTSTQVPAGSSTTASTAPPSGTDATAAPATPIVASPSYTG